MQTLEVYDGQYCVACTSADMDAPTWRTMYYPTGVPTESGLLDDMVGTRVRSYIGDTYQLEDRRVVTLVNGGKTFPLGNTTRPIPAPSRAKGWTWKDGAWVRGSRRVSYLYG